MAQKRKRRSNIFAGRHGQAVRNGAPDSAEFCAQLREHLAAELYKPCPEATDGSTTNFQALSAKLVQMAVKGSKDAIQIVLDRLAGKAQQAANPSDSGEVHVEYIVGIPRPNHDDTKDSTRVEVPMVPPAG